MAWFLYSFERKTIDLPLPPKGEAVYNPLYALKIALQRDGQRVQSRPHLFDDKHPLQAGDTVLILTDPARLSSRESEALRAHVMRGGHLVVQAPTALVGDGGSGHVARWTAASASTPSSTTMPACVGECAPQRRPKTTMCTIAD